MNLVFFLRGINVRGVKIKMADLRKIFEDLGYEDVKTVLATGNVLAKANGPRSLEDHKFCLEKALSQAYDYKASLFVKTCKDLKAISAKCPQGGEGLQTYLILYDQVGLDHDLYAAYKSVERLDQECLSSCGGDLFWTVKKGDTLQSNFGKIVLGSKTYKSKVTSRNIRTIHKIIDKCL